MFRWLRKPQIKAILPKIELGALWPDEISVKILEPDAKDGNVSLGELVIISQLVKLRNPLKIFEIGTFDGRTTLNMALNSSPNTEIFTLDLPPRKSDFQSEVGLPYKFASINTSSTKSSKICGWHPECLSLGKACRPRAGLRYKNPTAPRPLRIFQ